MAVNTLTPEALRSLADTRPESGRVLSLFLNLDPAEFGNAPARATAVNSLLTQADHAVEQDADLEHDERQALRADLERVRAELESSTLTANGTRGLAVFACGPADLFRVVRLPRPVETAAKLRRTPCLKPLIQASGPGQWCVLLANRRAARVFRGPADSLEETDRIDDDVHGQHDQGGWSQARFQRSVDKEAVDHLKHVGEVLFDAHQRQAFDHVLIGSPDELKNDLEGALHPYLRERIRGHVSIDVEHSTSDDVHRVAREAILEYEQEHERELLERLAEGLGRNTRAASGLHDVLTALNEARVETLLVREGLTERGVRDPRTDTLGREGASFPDGSRVEPVDDVIAEALLKAVEQSADIVVMRDPEDLVEHGGIAALLRF